MSEPYIMEWYPEDGGYASLAIHSFDILCGTLDGINSAGLVVSILADNEAMWELGPKLEPHLGPQQAIGLHELALMRLLLDTCATVAEAKETLLTIKQYYRIAPLHYIVADKAGRSFVGRPAGRTYMISKANPCILNKGRLSFCRGVLLYALLPGTRRSISPRTDNRTDYPDFFFFSFCSLSTLMIAWLGQTRAQAPHSTQVSVMR